MSQHEEDGSLPCPVCGDAYHSHTEKRADACLREQDRRDDEEVL